MTKPPWGAPWGALWGVDATLAKRFFTQVALVVLINVPSVSFGLAMGWVSLESGEGLEEGEGGAALVGAAAATFLAGALAMPLAARAIAAGRKPAMLATSAAFILCWSLKLCGGWGVVAGRAAAGLGGTAAWVIPPMLALEMCCQRVRGAAAVALVLGHNMGFLLMYLAADYDVPHRTVLLCCLGLSVVHFIAYLFVPESPAYLAAHGRLEEARAALAWCRGVRADSSELAAELEALPEPDLQPISPYQLAKDMLSDIRRRKAFIISLVAVVGQEMCGVLTLLQFAERVFSLAQGGAGGRAGGDAGGRRPASDAVVLGAVQLAASALSLYLVEKIGRRPLLVWGALGTGAGLALGAGAAWARSGRGALLALAGAVLADSAGLQPAPYALLAEMFTYQYRGCASLLVTAASDLANAAELAVFPATVQAAGLAAALALAGALTLLLAAFAYVCVPETMDRTPEQIYEALCPGLVAEPSAVNDHTDYNTGDIKSDMTGDREANGVGITSENHDKNGDLKNSNNDFDQGDVRNKIKDLCIDISTIRNIVLSSKDNEFNQTTMKHLENGVKIRPKRDSSTYGKSKDDSTGPKLLDFEENAKIDAQNNEHPSKDDPTILKVIKQGLSQNKFIKDEESSLTRTKYIIFDENLHGKERINTKETESFSRDSDDLSKEMGNISKDSDDLSHEIGSISKDSDNLSKEKGSIPKDSDDLSKERGVSQELEVTYLNISQ